MNRVVIESSECKGCRLCVEACLKHCLSIGSGINSLGYQFARFEGVDCNACGFCFYVCPEPGAITVFGEAAGEEVPACGSL